MALTIVIVEIEVDKGGDQMTLDETIENELKTSDAYFEQADKLNDMRATTTDYTSREQYKEMAVDLIDKGANHRMLAVWLKQYKKLKDAY